MALGDRAAAKDELAHRAFDLLVIGGGIIGAGIAAEAAREGLAVALVERGDFGAGTSSASSKLIHGGLRYLMLGDIGLVREAHRERRLLMQLVAPHLVRRLPFLLPLYRGAPYSRLTVQAGLVLYSALARSRLHRLASPARAQDHIPGLKLDGLRSCGVYADAVTHDGRLCLANVRAAAEAGATVLNYAEVRELRTVRGRAAGAMVAVDGMEVEVSARTVVNATGAWVDQVRRLEDPGSAPSVRLSKGAHVLLRLDEPWAAALTIPHDAVRVSFAVPWFDMLLLGTTDTLHGGDPEEVEATDAEVEQILGEAGVAISSDLLSRDAICSTFAGLRVLPVGDGATVSARREMVLHRGPAGMLSVAGGKLTTYRRIASTVLSVLRPELGTHRVDRRPLSLPGAADPNRVVLQLARGWPDLPLRTRVHLAHLYGSFAEDVLVRAAADPDLLRPLHPDGPDIAAQAVYARDLEWAVRPDDILRRRTTLSLHGLVDEAAVALVQAVLGRETGTVAPSSPVGSA